MIPFHYVTKIIIIFFVSLIPLKIECQKVLPRFEEISINEGLSQNTVRDILQDKKGFIWIATEDGLNKYEGYKFTIYRHDELDTNSISDNFIWSLCEDSEGYIWIGTNTGGLNRFNPVNETFKNYTHDPLNSYSISNNNARILFIDNEELIWIGTQGGGLNKFDKESGRFVQYTNHHQGVVNNTQDANSLSSNNIISITQDKKGYLWIGTNDGLNRFDKETEEFLVFKNDPKDAASISNNVITSLFIDSKERIWIGTDNGLNILDSSGSHFRRYIKIINSKYSFYNNPIISIVNDHTGSLWIGTAAGFALKIRDYDEFVDEIFASVNFYDISSHNISYVFVDNSGIIWFGTVGGGLKKYDGLKNNFLHYKHDPNNINSISNNTVRSIYEDDEGILWIGTIGGGLNKFDRKSNKITRFYHDGNDENSLSDNDVISLLKDKNGVLWIGTWDGGLNKLIEDEIKPINIRTNVKGKIRFLRYKHNIEDSNSLSDNIVQNLYEDSRGNIWIGTGSGLNIYNPKHDNFTVFKFDPQNPTSISDNRIQSNCILEDKSGNLWIGTWSGLNKLNKHELGKLEQKIKSSKYEKINLQFERFIHDANDPQSISDSRVISMYLGDNEDLWAGTHGGGLNKLVYETTNSGDKKITFIHYSEKDGLPNNIVYGILGDDHGNLWLSTNNGLSKFNVKTNRFINYYENDGLQSNQFFWGACYKNESGELFFGGINGLNAFFPSNLKENPFVPPIVFTDLKVFDKSIKYYNEDSPLNVSVTYSNGIKLDYDEYAFSLEFASLDYSNPPQNKYNYILEGFDPDWRDGGNQRFVTYTNLDPGNYIFRVKGSNNHGVWNNEGASIKISVIPPFWKTWWFIFLLIITIGGTITYFLTSHVKQLLAVERLRTKLAADLHDNIGSSLTEISILSEVITKTIKEKNEPVIKNLKTISESSRSLVDKMSDIVWLVNPQRDSLYDLILRLNDNYSELLSYTDISFRSENLKSLQRISLAMEHRQHLYLIFKEAINNCITHSDCDEIILNAYVDKRELTMVLKDNGKGFNIGEKFLGSGLNNMKKRAEKIGGKLEIESNLGKGTTIKFVGRLTKHQRNPLFQF